MIYNFPKREFKDLECTEGVKGYGKREHGLQDSQMVHLRHR